MTEASPDLRRAVLIVAALNTLYGVVEFGVALNIGSVSLFADSVDFFEDASVNLLIFFALVWPLKIRARVGMGLAAILLIPALAGAWTAVQKLQAPIPPDPFVLSLTGLGALCVNFTCAFILGAYRTHSGSLARAAFLSSRNDVIANVAIIGAGLVTAYLWRSVWPDLIVGGGIACLNVDAARVVWKTAQEEHRSVRAITTGLGGTRPQRPNRLS
jgi:Co/Zn/Cd efflux system component